MYRHRAQEREQAFRRYRATAPARPTAKEPGVVYTIELAGGVYVGQTAHYEARRSYHLSALRHQRHPNKAMQAAYAASLEEPVFTVVFQNLGKDAREHAERYVIALHASHCFNVRLLPISGVAA